MESKLFLLQIPLNIFPRATLPARVTWPSSPLQSPPLSSVSTGVSTQLPQRCSKMLASANQPGPTMSRSTLPLGTATNHTWCYFNHTYILTIPGVYILKVSNLSIDTGWSFTWLRPSPHPRQGCQGGPNCQPGALAGGWVGAWVGGWWVPD